MGKQCVQSWKGSACNLGKEAHSVQIDILSGYIKGTLKLTV